MKDNIEELELYLPANEEMSDSIIQNWTPQAIECYSIECNCKNCSISNGHYSFVCQMPKVIDSLIKNVGIPEELKKRA